jgi:hypothetical protein
MNRFSSLSNIDESMIGVVIIGVVVGLAIGLTILILYLLNLQNALKQVAPQNRTMEPGMVWLAIIPFFNYYWNFRIARDISNSLAAEYRMRGLPLTEERPGYQIGMAYAILTCCGILSWFGIPVLPELCGLAGFICWIIYWVRIAKYKNELKLNAPFAIGNPNPYPFPNQFPGQPPQPANYQQPSNYQQPPNFPPPPPDQNPFNNPNQP